MKKYLFICISIFIISCSSTRHYKQLTTGKWISKKEYDAFMKNAVDSAWSHLSEQDKVILSDTSYKYILVLPDSIN